MHSCNTKSASTCIDCREKRSSWYRYSLEHKCDVVEVSCNRGDIVFSNDDEEDRILDARYW